MTDVFITAVINFCFFVDDEVWILFDGTVIVISILDDALLELYLPVCVL